MLTIQAFIQSPHLGLWLQFLEPFFVLSSSEFFWDSGGLLLLSISLFGFYFFKSVKSVNFPLSTLVAKFVETFQFLWLLLLSLVYPFIVYCHLRREICMFNWESTPNILSFLGAIFYIWLLFCVLQLRSKFIFISLLRSRSNPCPTLSSIYISLVRFQTWFWMLKI